MAALAADAEEELITGFVIHADGGGTASAAESAADPHPLALDEADEPADTEVSAAVAARRTVKLGETMTDHIDKGFEGAEWELEEEEGACGMIQNADPACKAAFLLELEQLLQQQSPPLFQQQEGTTSSTSLPLSQQLRQPPQQQQRAKRSSALAQPQGQQPAKSPQQAELNPQELSQEIQCHFKAYLREYHTYVTEKSLYLRTFPWRLASYWDSESEEGWKLFVLDMHMSSTACNRPCDPAHCPHHHPDGSPTIPVHDRGTHVEETLHSLGFFDLCSHQGPLLEVLQRGHATFFEVGHFRHNSLHAVLDAFYRDNLFGTLHSMDTERTVGQLHWVMGGHTSFMTTQRQFMYMNTQGSAPPLEVTKVLYNSWRRQAVDAAKLRKAEKLTKGATDEGGPIPDLLRRLDAEAAKAALVAEKREARAKADALAAEAGEEKREKRELCALVRSLKYKPYKIMALKGVEPETDPAEIDSLPVKDVVFRLLGFSLRDLQTVCLNILPLVDETIAARDAKDEKEGKVKKGKKRKA